MLESVLVFLIKVITYINAKLVQYIDIEKDNKEIKRQVEKQELRKVLIRDERKNSTTLHGIVYYLDRVRVGRSLTVISTYSLSPLLSLFSLFRDSIHRRSFQLQSLSFLSPLRFIMFPVFQGT